MSMERARKPKTIDELKALVTNRAKTRGVLSLTERRAAMDRNIEIFPVPAGVTIAAVDLDGLNAEWTTVDEAADAPVLLYFHGGGYTQGSALSHRPMTARLALAARSRVLSVDYALAPENPFPAAVEDGIKAYRWLLAQGHAPEEIAIGGDSAGGGLTAAVLVAARDAGLPMPAGAVLLSPWTDLTCDTPTYETCATLDPIISKEGIDEHARAYLGGADARHPLASPNFADLRGLPPMLIHVGSDEVLLDDARVLAARARAAGVAAEIEVWPGMIHVWHAFYQMLPEGEAAIETLGTFLRERFAVAARA